MDLSFIEINGEKFIKTSDSLKRFDEIIYIGPYFNPPRIHIIYTFDEGLKSNSSTITLECMEKNCSEMIDILITEYKKTFKKKVIS